MKKTKIFIKTLSVLLVLLVCLPLIAACKARPLSQTKPAKNVVGTVGEYSVLYEELYFLANGYSAALKDKYAGKPEELKAAVWDKIYENITANYAILALCASEGLVYDEKALKEDVEHEIELMIEANFGSSRSEYFKSQEAEGLTDHYVRFFTGVDILYGQLATKYKETGVVPNTDEELLNYINKNFIHTNHIAIYVNENESYETEKAKAQKVLRLLESGISMYDLIGDYSEAPTETGVYGYYFPKGYMDKQYEDVAFSLSVGGHSDVVEIVSDNGGVSFYIIERWTMDQKEISENFESLSDIATEGLIASKTEAISETLTFVPNEYALSLDVTNLEPAESGFDYILVIGIASAVASLAAIIAAAIVITKIKTKKFHQKNKLSKRSS